MYWLIKSHTALYVALTLCLTTVESRSAQKFTLGSHSPPAFNPPSPNTQAAHVLNLTAKPGVPKSAGYLQSLRQGNHVDGVYGLTPVNSGPEQLVLTAYLQVGAQSFQLQIDTGSSDTWVAGQNFQCMDEATDASLAESACVFGPTYTPTATFNRIEGENFHTTYGDGEAVSGVFGKETVTVAGIPVHNQQIAIVDRVKGPSDGLTSGILGLAFPSLTSAYAGTDPAKTTKRIIYDPILTNLFGEAQVSPLFSLAITRSTVTSGSAFSGLLAIGGLPPVQHSSTFAATPLLFATIDFDGNPVATPQYQFYQIKVNGFTYKRSSETTQTGQQPPVPNPLSPPNDRIRHRVIVDSGSSLIYLPTHIADAVNALFDPPAVYDSTSGTYTVNCSAEVPEFGVEIGTQAFYVNPEDLIIDFGNEVCTTGVSDAGAGMSVLGIVFLKNVLAVFDIGASEMRFAAREVYKS